MRSPRASRRSLDELNARLAQLDARLKEQVEVPVERLNRIARRMEERTTAGHPAADPGFVAAADEMTAGGRTLLGRDRLGVLWQAAANAAHLGLPAVELGVYRGGSAAFLARAFAAAGAPGLPFYAFDTFQGHEAEAISEFDPHHRAGLFADASFEDVRAYLSEYAGVEVHPVAFPAAIELLPPGGFSLAHVDTDLYEPTRSALAFFCDRMPPGAVVVVDDYGADKTGGVLRAVREFLAAEPPFQRWEFGTEQIVLVRRPDVRSGDPA